MHFGTGKSRDVLCRACRTARRDTLVTTSATRRACRVVTQQMEFGLMYPDNCRHAQST